MNTNITIDNTNVKNRKGPEFEQLCSVFGPIISIPEVQDYVLSHMELQFNRHKKSKLPHALHVSSRCPESHFISLASTQFTINRDMCQNIFLHKGVLVRRTNSNIKPFLFYTNYQYTIDIGEGEKSVTIPLPRNSDTVIQIEAKSSGKNGLLYGTSIKGDYSKLEESLECINDRLPANIAKECDLIASLAMGVSAYAMPVVTAEKCITSVDYIANWIKMGFTHDHIVGIC